MAMFVAVPVLVLHEPVLSESKAQSSLGLLLEYGVVLNEKAHHTRAWWCCRYTQ